MLCVRSSGLILRQAFRRRLPPFCSLFLQSHVALQGSSLISTHSDSSASDQLFSAFVNNLNYHFSFMITAIFVHGHINCRFQR